MVASPQFSYWWNPQPYYPVGFTDPPATSVTPLATGNQVVMTPSACPGWSFDHWEYKNAQGQWISTSGNPLQGGALTVHMNWWTGAGIHVPDSHMVFHVKAVFAETGYGVANMPFKYRLSQNGATISGVRQFWNVAYNESTPTYCCQNHRDPDGNKYCHAHLPHGFPFDCQGTTITQQMSDWAWDAEYANQTRQSGSTFRHNCYSYSCDAPTVMFHEAWYNNFTLSSSLSEATTQIRSFGDDDHVIRITGIYNKGTEQNPEYVVSHSVEKNGSSGIYSGAWLPMGLETFGSIRKLKPGS